MKHSLHFRLHEVADYVNWLYFFHAWGFPARYASIATIHGCEACWQNWLQGFGTSERDKATEAVKLFRDAQEILRLMDERYQTHAMVGLFTATTDGDDILIPGHRLPMLRQQTGETCISMTDFIANGDTIGLFATTVDEGLEQEYTLPADDYRHMLCQTLADRLAEATAERAHEITRKTLWGYAPDESLTLQELLREDYQGKRPAVGYPSLPDQSLNFILSDILDMPSLGITLTESGAMHPHASTSGLMIANPRMKHFSVGRIGEDQLADYAARRGLTIERQRQFQTSIL